MRPVICSIYLFCSDFKDDHLLTLLTSTDLQLCLQRSQLLLTSPPPSSTHCHPFMKERSTNQQGQQFPCFLLCFYSVPSHMLLFTHQGLKSVFSMTVSENLIFGSWRDRCRVGGETYIFIVRLLQVSQQHRRLPVIMKQQHWQSEVNSGTGLE